MSASVFKLLYMSVATRPMTEADLVEILEESRANNGPLGLTGILLYADGSFLQLLEGEEGAVRALYARISRDPRHAGVALMYTEHAAERDFPDWTMGFARPPRGQLGQVLEGCNRLVQGALPPEELAQLSNRARSFVRAFRTAVGLRVDPG